MAAAGAWVVQQAAADSREWRRRGLPPVRVAVNISPPELRRRDIARAILRFPGKAFAHRVPDKLIAEFRQCITLCGMPGALDELHHADALSPADHPQREPERSGRFTLAAAGVDDQQAFLDRLAGYLGVLHSLALRRLGAMALGFGLVDRIAHALPFTNSGRPATISTTTSARAAIC